LWRFSVRDEPRLDRCLTFRSRIKKTATGASSQKPFGGITLASGAGDGAIKVSTNAGVIIERAKENI
jgi:hypothetical protein